MTEYKYYRGPEGEFYRAHLERDEDAESPRDSCDNASTLVTWEPGYFSPDNVQDLATRGPGFPVPTPFPRAYTQPRNYGGIDLRHIHKYAALFLPEVLYVTGLERGPVNGGSDTLATTENENRAVGIAYVTAADWKMCMSDSPLEGGRTPSVREVIEQDVAAYNNWGEGNYVGRIVEQARRWTGENGDVMFTWDDTDFDCWGFDDEDYAWESVLDTLPDGTVQLSADEAAELAE